MRILVICLLAFFSVSSLLADPFAESPRICVLVATDRDAAVFERASSVKPLVRNVAGWSFRLLEIGSRKILLGKVGRGPADASSSATAALSSSPSPWYLISVSPAAGLCSQSVGTLAAASSTSVSTLEEALDLVSSFPEGAVSLPVFPLRSVDSFVDSDSESLEFSTAGFCLLDMNAHWLTLAARRAGAVHIPVRVVSDAADGAAGETFRSFIESYDGSAATASLEVISRLPIPGNSALAHENLREVVSEKYSPSPGKSR